MKINQFLSTQYGPGSVLYVWAIILIVSITPAILIGNHIFGYGTTGAVITILLGVSLGVTGGLLLQILKAPKRWYED